jgi:4,5-dihydroxyphthalate decarboxylase
MWHGRASLSGVAGTSPAMTDERLRQAPMSARHRRETSRPIGGTPLSKNIPITLACGDYEITRALKEGTVTPDGIDLTVLTDMDSTTRHWRFLRNRDFDMAETSASSYIVARGQDWPVRALPVFLHRRFRHGFVFVNTTKGISKPTDLIGRRIGIKSFLVTAIHWMRGLLEKEYGVPHTAVEWVAELDEDVDFTPPPGLKLTRLPHDKSVETMLAEGGCGGCGRTTSRRRWRSSSAPASSRSCT